jgi:hypothetical protein
MSSMRRSPTLLLGLALLTGLPAFAQGKPTIVYKPKLTGTEVDRPVATRLSVASQGSGYAIRLDFDRDPWGEGCRERCARLSFLLDTDNAPSTGHAGSSARAAENGADLVVTVEGVREYGGPSADAVLKVTYRLLPDGSRSLEEGQVIGEYDHRNDKDQVQVKGASVFLFVDPTESNLPTGRKVRVIYNPPGRPPGSKPLVGIVRGLL